MRIPFNGSCGMIAWILISLLSISPNTNGVFAEQPKVGKEMENIQNNPILLWEGTPPANTVDDGFRPTLTPYVISTEKSVGAVIVVPGGGYGGRADHERGPIADFFNQAGLQAFVLDYRVSPQRHPAPLLDAERAVRLVRYHADEWHVKPDKIAVLGFSAGGHLTGSLGVFFTEGDSKSPDPVDHFSSRPDAIVLCYPVISSSHYGHKGSFKNLLGEDAPPELIDQMSLEKQVRPDTPATFLWHTADDEVVPVENSLMFATALSEKKIPYELHVYPHGPHGLGLAQGVPHVATWGSLCVEWLRGMGW